MVLRNCHNFHDFRRLAKRRLPGPIFDYIDGAADEETTHRRNTKAFESCDLVPSVLRGVGSVDLSVTVMGQKLAMPVYCSPTALQRLFYHRGERAVGWQRRNSEQCLAYRRLAPSVWRSYVRRTTRHRSTSSISTKTGRHAMIRRAKEAGVNIMMLTVAIA
jgi:L-lactate dehydrogenase (cytochrome)